MKLEKRKSLMPLLGLAAMALCGTSNAADQQMNKRSHDRNASSHAQQHKNGQFRQITPNAGPTVHNGADIFVTANFIYWRAYQSGLSYAAPAVFNPLWGYDNNQPEVSSGNIGQDWGPGFKVGLGLDTAHDGWQVYAQYTWNSFSETSSTSYAPSTEPAAVSAGVASKLTNPNDSLAFTSDNADASWRLRFNKIDLMLSRDFFLSQYLTMKPAAGLTGTWQNQSLSTKYTRNTTPFVIGDSLTPAPTIAAYVQNDLVARNFGIGLRMGSEFSYYFTKQFSLYGDMYGNVYWTNYTTTSNNETLHSPANNASKTYIDQSNPDYYAVKFAGEMELGLMWETYFCERDYHFSMRAGWEMQQWFNWTQFSAASYTVNNSLSFQGLNLKFRFDF